MVIFWDFDGVIKDSVKVKSIAYEQLFTPFGYDVVKQVREHHETNGGLSRFDKLPIYLGWAGCVSTPGLVEEYSNKFSILVKRKVIESNWVPGVLEFIRNKTNKQSYFIISATPQGEIEEIIKYALGHGNLSGCKSINHIKLKEKGFTEGIIKKIEENLRNAFDIKFAFNK